MPSLGPLQEDGFRYYEEPIRFGRKNPYYVFALTLTGRPVLGGAFAALDRHGLPLSLQVELAAERGLTLSVPQFIVEAVRAGWDDATIERHLLTLSEDHA